MKRYTFLILILLWAIIYFPYNVGATDYYCFDLGISDGAGSDINDAGHITGYDHRDVVTRAFKWEPGKGLTNLGTLIPGYGYSVGMSINNRGQVVGYGSGANDVVAIMWDPFTGWRNLTPNMTGVAYGINDNSNVVGTYSPYAWTPNGRPYHAFIWNESSGFKDLGTFGGYSATANAINNKDQVVGKTQDLIGNSEGFAWSNSTGYIKLGNFVGNSINDNGYIAGSLNNRPVPVLFNLNTKDIIELGTSQGSALAVNNKNQVVGLIQDGAETHPFIWTEASGLKNLNVLNLPKTNEYLYPRDINNSGQILATANNHTFLLTPKEQPKVTLVTLAKMCEQISKPGNIDVEIDGQKYTFLSNISPVISNDGYKGFRAAAYANSDNSQIVIAFRGTEVDNTLPLLKNICSDSSFVYGVPTQNLKSSVGDAVNFVSQVIKVTGSTNITLTGHSLGGAIAQLVGLASGLETYAFNAPGAGQLYGQIFGSVDGKNGTNVNYRIYGDQVSLAGTPIGPTVTLQAPSGVNFVDIPDILGDRGQVIEILSNMKSIITVHGTDAIIKQLEKGYNNEVNPNYATMVINAIKPEFSIISPFGDYIEYCLKFSIFAEDSFLNLFDPVDGTKFVFAADPGSPHFKSLVLPTITGIDFYGIQSEADNVWSNLQSLLPGEEYFFGEGIDGIKFQAFDKDGKPIVLPDGFLFGLSFDSTGMFSGTLTVTSPAPIPSSILLFGFPLLLLGVSQLRSRYRRK